MNDIFSTGIAPTWCPGCGNYGIWMALKQALVKLGIASRHTVLVYGVGCHGNMRDWMNVYGVEGLHGRALPLSQGIKLANSSLSVIAVTGDGDCIGEGGNHLIHAAKRNPDITVIVHDNQVYGLTTGQASPTAEVGLGTKSTPQGVMEPPISPVSLALVSGAGFVSRGFAGDIPGLTDILVQAIQHKGFSLVDVLQPCVTFDPIHTYQWYRDRLHPIVPQKSRSEAIATSLEWGTKIPFGIFFREEKETSEERSFVDSNPLIRVPRGIPNREKFLQMFR